MWSFGRPTLRTTPSHQRFQNKTRSKAQRLALHPPLPPQKLQRPRIRKYPKLRKQKFVGIVPAPNSQTKISPSERSPAPAARACALTNSCSIALYLKESMGPAAHRDTHTHSPHGGRRPHRGSPLPPPGPPPGAQARAHSPARAGPLSTTTAPQPPTTGRPPPPNPRSPPPPKGRAGPPCPFGRPTSHGREGLNPHALVQVTPPPPCASAVRAPSKGGGREGGRVGGWGGGAPPPPPV